MKPNTLNASFGKKSLLNFYPKGTQTYALKPQNQDFTKY